MKESWEMAGGPVRRGRWHRSVRSRKPRAGSFEPLEERALLSVGGFDETGDALTWSKTPTPGWFSEVEPAAADASGAVVGALDSAADSKEVSRQGDSKGVENDQWIVRLTPEAARDAESPAGAADVLASSPGGVRVLRGLGLEGMILVQMPAGTEAEAAEKCLRENKGIAYFEPNAAVNSNVVPNDESFASLWGLHNTGQSGGTADADIDAPEAWDIGTGSTEIVVAVIDTGVDYTHPDLAGNIWTNPGEIPGNGLDDEGNGFVDDVHGYDFVNGDGDPIDDHGHGTHVAGTIAALGNNGAGVVGVNWAASVMALKFLDSSGSGVTADAISAINYSTMMRQQFGVSVRLTSNSWGGDEFDQSLYEAIEASGDAGSLFIAAAGNSGGNNDDVPQYPSSYDLDNIIAVAATDRNDQLANFSCYGPTSVDLAAPGVNIYSTTRGGGYATLSGTSMATPHVSGVAALAWSVEPSASAQLVRQALLGGADIKSSLDGRVGGGGRLNAAGTLNLLGMNVASATPAGNSIVAAPISEVSVDFSFPYALDTVDPADLTLNGIAADSVSLDDADSVTFGFSASPVTAEGMQYLEMAEGSVLRASDGDPLAAWDSQFFYDLLSMAVVSTVPTEGETLSVAPAEIVLNFNEPVDAATLGTDDLVLNQGTVTAAAAVDGYSVRYLVSGLVRDGLVTYRLNDGAITDSHGVPAGGYSGQFTVDDPRILQFTSGDVPQPILDVSTITSTLTVSWSAPIIVADVDIRLDINHTFDSDLEAHLIAPDGTRVELFTAVGGPGNNFSGTIFDDEAPTPIAAGIAPFAGRFQPAGMLSDVDGQDARGTWTLEVNDDSGFDEGVLNSWGLSIEFDGRMRVIGSAPAENDRVASPLSEVTVDFTDSYDPSTLDAADLTLNGIPADSVFPTDPDTAIFRFSTSPVTGEGPQQMSIAQGAILRESDGEDIVAWNSRFYYDVSPTAVVATAPSEGEMLVAAPTRIVLDFNEPIDASTLDAGDLVLDRGTVLAASAVDEDSVAYTVGGITGDVVVTYRLLEGAISDAHGNPASGYVGHFTLDDPWVVWFSSTDVPMNIPNYETILSTLSISGAVPLLVVDLNVQLDVKHTWDGDVDAYLIAPDGTRVELFTDVGGDGHDFSDTILDDEADIAINDGQPPFSGRFRPEGRLSAMDGRDARGTWTLEITDDASLDSGVLNRWGLQIEFDRRMRVNGSTPGEGTIVASPISDVTVAFSQPYDPATLDAADLTMNGVPADYIVSAELDAVTFRFSTSPVTAEGPQRLEIAEGAVLRGSDGAALVAWASRFFYDVLPTSVISTMPNEGQVLAAAPSEIVLNFNEPIDPSTVDASDLVLNIGTVAAAVIDADSIRYTVSGFARDQEVTYRLVDGALRDAHGTPATGYLGQFTLDDPLVVSFPSADVPRDITDFQTTYSTLTISAAEPLMIADIDVDLDITHTFDGDLAAYLIAPDGTTISLFMFVGGGGNNFTGTILDDEAPFQITGGTAPFTGRFRPASPLSVVDGGDARGNWTLEISDYGNYDVGVLNRWGLTLVPASSTSDVRLSSAAAGGTDGITLAYEIVGDAASPFAVGFYRSADNAPSAGDQLLDSLTIASAADLTPGVHTKTFTIGGGTDQVALPGAGAADDDSDYFLLAVADPQDVIDETAFLGGETNNTAVVTGVYHVDGGPVMVHGTAAAEAVRVLPNAASQRVHVEVADAVYEYSANGLTGVRVRGHGRDDDFQLRVDSGFGVSSVLAFLFHGGGGANTAQVWGSTSTTAKDVATIYPMTGLFRGPGYTVSLAGMRGMTVASQGGPDEAYIYDSSLNDTFTAYPTYATLSNSLYTNRAEGFRNVWAYAQAGGAYASAGGTDTANLYGIDGTCDYFRASATYAIRADSETGRGSTYFVRANWFEQVHAFGQAVGGRPSAADRDQAMLYDAATIDLFRAETETALAAYYYSAASTVWAHTFRVVKAYGSAGDTADLYGPGQYKASPNPVMWTPDYTVWANGFNPIYWHPNVHFGNSSSPAAVDAALSVMFCEEHEPGLFISRSKPEA